MLTPAQITPNLVRAVLNSDDEELKQDLALFLESPLHNFKPRPDNREAHDEQYSYVNDKTSRVQVCLKGTGAGGSECSAYKVAKFLLFDNPPPRKDTPLWIISETYDLSCGVGWVEKLSKYIPQSAIAEIAWMNQKLGYPQAVILKRWQGLQTNYKIEFKSAAQGRERLQAASIAGAWISEPLNDWSIFTEIDGRCRDYSWARIYWDQTPLIPQPELEEAYEQPPQGWQFYRQSTDEALAAGHVQQEWYDSFFGSSMPAEIRETRRIGAFSHYEGAIFKEFDPKVHLIPRFDIPKSFIKYRGLDFGNYFGCVWAALDPIKRRWYVFREYYHDYARQGGALIKDHARKIHSTYPWNLENCQTTYGDPADPTSVR